MMQKIIPNVCILQDEQQNARATKETLTTAIESLLENFPWPNAQTEAAATAAVAATPNGNVTLEALQNTKVSG